METPPLVRRALELAAAHGFERSSRPEDGALLHVLAARRGIARAAEIGTGAGVGTAWIASALPPGVPFFTAEIDPELAARAAELFADDPDVTVLAGSWRQTLPPEAPFDLLFVDGGKAKDDIEAVDRDPCPGRHGRPGRLLARPVPAGPEARRLARAPPAGDGRTVGDAGAAGARLRAAVTPSGEGYPCR